MSAVSASVGPLRAEFGSAVTRHFVSCGDTVVHVERERAHDVLAWLKDTPAQQFDYLTDITAVEYRDPERPLEVVWQLRSLARKADLRLKAELDPRQPLEVRSVYDLWRWHRAGYHRPPQQGDASSRQSRRCKSRGDVAGESESRSLATTGDAPRV